MSTEQRFAESPDGYLIRETSGSGVIVTEYFYDLQTLSETDEFKKRLAAGEPGLVCTPIEDDVDRVIDAETFDAEQGKIVAAVEKQIAASDTRR